MNDNDYHNYLLKRSFLSKIYRNNILYPVLCKEFRGKVLDIGCGIGDFLIHRENTVGIDINKTNVDYCRSKNLEAYEIINNSYPFPDQIFDGAILDNVVEHLIDPMPTLQESARILKGGGTLIVGVPGSKGYTMDSDHKKFYDEKALSQLLGAGHFVLKRFIYAPFMIRSEWLDRTISQYCLYGVFTKESKR